MEYYTWKIFWSMSFVSEPLGKLHSISKIFKMVRLNPQMDWIFVPNSNKFLTWTQINFRNFCHIILAELDEISEIRKSKYLARNKSHNEICVSKTYEEFVVWTFENFSSKILFESTWKIFENKYLNKFSSIHGNISEIFDLKLKENFLSETQNNL